MEWFESNVGRGKVCLLDLYFLDICGVRVSGKFFMGGISFCIIVV